MGMRSPGEAAFWSLPEGDLSAYMTSLERVRSLAPERILPGHGPEIRAAQELLKLGRRLHEG